MSDRSTGKKDNSSKSGKAARKLEEKRLAASERQEAYLALTLDEKLARIESRPGNSAKEKARLTSRKGQ